MSGRPNPHAHQFLDVFTPFYGIHIQQVPTFFKSREEFQTGTKWQLAQWLKTCNGRFATRHHDTIFAGIGLIDIDSLRIEPNMQADQTVSPVDVFPAAALNGTGRSPVNPNGMTSQRLWSVLHADYKVGFAEVLVNVAGCLLSRPNCTNILSLVGVFGDTGPDGQDLDK